MFQTESGREIIYYGSEYAESIRRKGDKNIQIETIDDLFPLLLKAWCRETAYPSCQKDYDKENDPTYGQCAITATLIYDMFGGTIHKVRVSGGGTHYFNKIDGHYFDLTRDQFDLYDLPLDYEPNEEIPRAYCGKSPDTLKRYRLLVQRISRALQE